MARSYNIYIPLGFGGKPFRAFTVKKEAKEWLRKWNAPSGYVRGPITRVMTLRDGDDGTMALGRIRTVEEFLK